MGRWGMVVVGAFGLFSIAAAPPHTGRQNPQRTPFASPAQQSRPIPLSGNLNAADLIEIGKLASAKADQFSDDPSLRYVGRQFVVTIPSGDLSIGYDKGTKELKVSTQTYVDGFELRRDTNRSEYVGQNGYGAKTVVTSIRGTAYGIEYPGERYSKKAIAFSKVLEPSEARDLSKALALRLTGTIIKADGIWAKSGSIFFEHHIIADATVSNPYDTFVRRYYIAATFTKAEWIDMRSGAVVQTDTL